MTSRRTPSRRTPIGLERCEDRALTTLIFVFNGNSFAATGPDSLTANAAAVLHRAGNQVVQLSNPAINATSFNALGRRLVTLAHGQDVALVGFSAGGALALRLSTTPGLKVDAVLDYYGVPDVASFVQRHDLRPISGLAPFRSSVVSLFSGPVTTAAKVVAAYGLRDPNVNYVVSAPALLKDDPTAHVYAYNGAHGVPITASVPALDDFLADLN